MSEYVRIENDKILYNSAKMELFVPDEYFKTRLATEVGTGFTIFGYARAFHYGYENDDRSKATKTVLAYPLMMTTYPSQVSIEKLSFNGRPMEKFHVFTYYKNDVLFSSSKIIQDANNVLNFFLMLMNGKLDIIEYKYIPRMLQKCKAYNKVGFGTPAMYEEVIIADYYRNPNNHSEPARFAAATAKDPFYALGITQREKVSNVSTFSGITFEDITAMLTKADNNARNGAPEYISQIEINSLGRNKQNKNG